MHTKKIIDNNPILRYSEFDPADEQLIGRKVTLILGNMEPLAGFDEKYPRSPEEHVGRIINRR